MADRGVKNNTPDRDLKALRLRIYESMEYIFFEIKELS